ncbi:PE-PPE domain-containing protein [Gordonia sp. OPL2]|uniref:cutinase family protein n=1 Tax=Gordonia sp. OPL2 TaxID=2486274 RepID=UPI00165623EE|nr:PE-PPE domain-containing protein [Gordonia sp. OPL2]RPA12195.1 PE-PPE domain-containing protein [Gordonia sp. OPL2]
MSARFGVSRRLTVILIAISTSIAVAAAFCLPGVGGVARADDCGAGAVVIVGGTWDHEGAVMVGVKQRYTGLGPDNQPNPGSDYAGDNAYKIIYADYPATVWPAGATGYDESTRQGIASTKSAIAGYQQTCNGKPVVVAGYSQGARIAGDVLSDIGNGRDSEVTITDKDGNPVVVSINSGTVSGELYADPRQGGDKTGRGIELSLIGVIPGLTMSGAREGLGDRGFGTLEDTIVSVCIDGDPICDLPDPIYDPIGAIDGLAGYWVKHGRYPYYMFEDPRQDWWSDRDVECEGTNDTSCTVEFDSSIVEYLREQAANLGYTGEIGDFLANRPKIGLPLGITLANLQPAIRVVQDLLPPLPQLGYGAYLPDIYVFEDILQGIVNRAPDRFTAGAAALAASVRSIIRWPVSFTSYWADQLVTVVGAQTAVQTTTSRSAGETPASVAVEQHVQTLQTLAAVEHPSASVVETSTPDAQTPTTQIHDDGSASAPPSAVDPVAPARSEPEPQPEPQPEPAPVVETPPVVAAEPEPETPPADTRSTSGGVEPGAASDQSTGDEASPAESESTGGSDTGGESSDSTSGSSKKSSESSSEGSDSGDE